MADDIVDQAIDKFIAQNQHRLMAAQLPPTGQGVPSPETAQKLKNIFLPSVPKSPMGIAGKALEATIPGASTIGAGIRAEKEYGPIRTKEDVVNNLPMIAAGGMGALTGGMGIVPAMAYAGVAGAGGQGYKQVIQTAQGLPDVPKTPLEAAQRVGKEGLIPGALSEAGGRIANQTLKYGAKAIGGTITKLGEFFTNVEKEAVTRGSHNTHLTTEAALNQQGPRIEGIAKNLAQGVKEAEDTVRMHYDLALKNTKKTINGQTVTKIFDEEMPAAGFKKVKGQLKRLVGLNDASDQIAERLSDIRTKVVAETKRSKQLSAQHLLSLRDELTEAMSYAKNLGQEKGTHIINNLKNRVNGLLDTVSPAVRATDKEFGSLVDTVRDLKNEFGLPQNLKDANSIPLSTVKRVQSFVENFYKKGDAEVNRVKALAEKLGKTNQIISKSADAATVEQFSGQMPSSSLNVSSPAKTMTNIALKSRRLFGATLRGRKATGRAITKSEPYVRQSGKVYMADNDGKKK